MHTRLDGIEVNEIFRDCLFDDGEDQSVAVFAEGITVKVFGFHPQRLEAHRDEIQQMLWDLPKEFQESEMGAGAPLLEAGKDKHGNRWAKDFDNIQELYCLGLALKLIISPYERAIWKSLPGGFPLFIVVGSKKHVRQSDMVLRS